MNSILNNVGARDWEYDEWYRKGCEKVNVPVDKSDDDKADKDKTVTKN